VERKADVKPDIKSDIKPDIEPETEHNVSFGNVGDEDDLVIIHDETSKSKLSTSAVRRQVADLNKREFLSFLFDFFSLSNFLGFRLLTVLKSRGASTDDDEKPEVKPEIKPEAKPLMSSHPLSNHPSFISPPNSSNTNRNLFGSESSGDSGRASGQQGPRLSGGIKIAKDEHRTEEGVVFYRVLQAPVRPVPRGIDPPDLRFFTVDNGQMVSISVNID
jgi:hypothetical protein